MSELPPKTRGNLAKAELFADKSHSIVSRKIEEGEILPDGKRSVETIVECNGQSHTELREAIRYDQNGSVVSVEDMAPPRDLGPCDGQH